MTNIGSLLTLVLFAAFLAQPSPVQAMEKPDPAQSGEHASEAQQKDKSGKHTEKRGGIPDVEDCILDQGCLAHVVTAAKTEKSMQGTTCKNGTMACNHPGASCAIGGTRHCRTFDLNAAGNCTCACIAP